MEKNPFLSSNEKKIEQNNTPEQEPVTIKELIELHTALQEPYSRMTKPHPKFEKWESAKYDTITNEILECIECSRNYKIVPDELTLYRKMKIPLPRRCFYCRLSLRLKMRNPYKLWKRACMCELSNHEHQGKCSNEFETSYAPGKPETVYCEECYQKEIA